MTGVDKDKLGAPEEKRGDAPQFEAAELLALLRRDLQHIEKELSAFNAESTSPVTKDVAAAASDLREAVGGFLEKAHVATETASHGIGEQAEKFRERIERHPMAAVSSAFALGYFLGRTVFRKGHNAPNS